MNKNILNTLTLLLISIFLISCLSNDKLIKESTDIKKDGKPIMLIFSSNTCPYCERFRKDLEENKELNLLAKQMDIYDIQRDNYKEYTLWGEKTNLRTLEKLFTIKITPNVIIFDKLGRKIWQIPGYANPKLLIPYLKFVQGLDNGKYKITQWKKYLKETKIID